MKTIAFVNRHAPHGTAAGREALDAVLATSALTEDISVFFIGDGVYQLVANQQPAAIHQRNFSQTFGLLEVYDVEQIFICATSLAERGLSTAQLCLEGECLSREAIATQIAQHQAVLNF